MGGTSSDLDERLRAVEAALVDVQRRLGALESRAGPDRLVQAGPEFPPELEEAAEPDRPRASGASSRVVSLIGRTVMVLGGAFLLRAITEAGSLPRAGGAAIGFAYAVAWFGIADRAVPQSRESGVFHGLAGLVIGLPLLWEVGVRFGAAGPWVTAAGLFVVTLAALAVSLHRHLFALAAVTAVAVSGTAFLLALATGRPAPFVVVMLLALVAVTTFDDEPGWIWLEVPLALTTALLMAVLVLRAAGEAPLVQPAWMFWLSVLYAAFGVWCGVGRLARRRVVPWTFGGLHATGALSVGVGGCVIVAARLGAGLGAAVALIALLLAVSCYALALAVARDRPGRRAAVRLLALQGLLLVAIATPVVFDQDAAALWLSALAVVFSWGGARRLVPELLGHGAIYAAAAAVVAGLPAAVAAGWVQTVSTWPPAPQLLWVVVVAATTGLVGPRLAADDPGARVTAAARLILAAVCSAGVLTMAVLIAGPMILGASPGAGPVAALRSLALAAAAVALTFTSTLPRARAFGRLAVPVLVLGAVKIVVEDAWRSGPLLLFVALAGYGLALAIRGARPSA